MSTKLYPTTLLTPETPAAQSFFKQVVDCCIEAKGEIEAFTQNKMLMITQQTLVDNKTNLIKTLEEPNPSSYITSPKSKEE